MTLDLFTNVAIRFGLFIQRETQLVIHCHVIFWHTRFDLRLSPGLGGGTQDNSQNMCVRESTVSFLNIGSVPYGTLKRVQYSEFS